MSELERLTFMLKGSDRWRTQEDREHAGKLVDALIQAAKQEQAEVDARVCDELRCVPNDRGPLAGHPQSLRLAENTDCAQAIRAKAGQSSPVMVLTDGWIEREPPNDDEGPAARRASAEGAAPKNLQERNIE